MTSSLLSLGRAQQVAQFLLVQGTVNGTYTVLAGKNAAQVRTSLSAVTQVSVYVLCLQRTGRLVE